MNLEELKEKYEKQKAKSAGQGDLSDTWLNLKRDEEVTVRILPYGEEEGDFFFETAIHYINDEKYACPRQTPSHEGDDCPICKEYFDIWKEINVLGKDNPEAKPLVALQKAVRASSRYYFNVVDRRDGKVKIMSQGYKIYSKIMDAINDEDYGNGKIPVHDLQNGWDFKLKMEFIDGYNNFDKSKFRPKSTPAGTPAEIATWMDERHDLSALVKEVPYEDLKLAQAEIESTRREITAPPETKGMEGTDDDGEGMSEGDFIDSMNS